MQRTRFSGLCSSCVVEAQRVMRDLNMQPTTTASMFWATDLLSPVVKLFPKPALSGNKREGPRITQGAGQAGGGEDITELSDLSGKNTEPVQQVGEGGGKGKGVHTAYGGEAN